MVGALLKACIFRLQCQFNYDKCKSQLGDCSCNVCANHFYAVSTDFQVIKILRSKHCMVHLIATES